MTAAIAPAAVSAHSDLESASIGIDHARLSAAMHVLDLPSEVIHHIFSFLPLTTILRLAAVSHSFHKLITQETTKRQRRAAKLRNQSFCYHLFAPIDRFGVPLVRCTAIGDRQHRHKYAQDQEQDQEHMNAHRTALTPRLECRTVIVQQHESALAKTIKCIQTERRVRLDSEVRFAQLIYKFEIIQYSPSTAYSKHGTPVGRCSGSCVVAEGVVRIFRTWLDESVAMQVEQPERLGSLALPVDNTCFTKDKQAREDMLVLRTSVRAGAFNEHTGDKTYFVKVHDVEINSTFLVIKSEQAEASGARQDAQAYSLVSATIVQRDVG